MIERRKSALVLIIMAFLLAGTSAVALADDFFPLSEVRPGMTGYGRTVIKGSTIETFDVEIMGVLENQGLAHQLILVRVGGPVIEASGGIAQGMSGSPVYLDGKLLGALSYGYGFADHTIGLVTPIGAMLSILELVPGEVLTLQSPVVLNGQVYNAVALGPTTDPATLELIPVATPLLVSGMGPRGVARLQRLLADRNIVVRSAGAGSDDTFQAPLEPGSPLAVDLITGDIRAAALGTLTYLDPSGRFVAFGHPLTSRGNSNYVASYARILTTVQSIETPFKIGVPGANFGTILQDRQAGIAGQIGLSAKVIPVKVRVKDLDLQRRRDYSFSVIQDPALSVNLIDSAVLQAIDNTLDRIGPGTALMELSIYGEDLPAGGFTRRNLFFSSVDIAAVALSELYEALDLVLNNEFKEVEISEVSASIMVEQQRRTAKIEKARILNEPVYPGDTVEVEVTLRPWRQNPITRVVKLELPANIQPGEVTLTVRNGTYNGPTEDAEIYHADELEKPGKPDVPTDLKTKKADAATKTNAESLELLISDFVLREKNNQVIVEFYPALSYEPSEPDYPEALEIEAEEEVSIEAETEIEVEKPQDLAVETLREEFAATEYADDDYEVRGEKISASLDTEFVVEGTTSVSMFINAYVEPEPGEEIRDWSGVSIRYVEGY